MRRQGQFGDELIGLIVGVDPDRYARVALSLYAEATAFLLNERDDMIDVLFRKGHLRRHPRSKTNLIAVGQRLTTEEGDGGIRHWPSHSNGARGWSADGGAYGGLSTDSR